MLGLLRKRIGPAAKLIHQAYMGGLLEHSLQTARIVSMVADLYPLAEKDLVVAVVEEFPKKLHLALRHIIISHHGRYEWQSPKKPKNIEAC